MSYGEREARLFCTLWDLDPDEVVKGTMDGPAGWCSAPRWCWYRSR